MCPRGRLRQETNVEADVGEDRTDIVQLRLPQNPFLSASPEDDQLVGDPSCESPTSLSCNIPDTKSNEVSVAAHQPMSYSLPQIGLSFADAFTTEGLSSESISFESDAAFEFTDDINIEAIEQILESLAGFDEMGRIDIDQWPSKHQPLVRQLLAVFDPLFSMIRSLIRLQVVPPRWLTEALHELRHAHSDVSVEGVMQPYEIDIQSELPTSNTLEDGATAGRGFKIQLLPRVRCLDCPNKLYVARPGSVIDDLSIHMRNRLHKQSVNLRRSVDSQRVARVVQLMFHAIKHQRFDQLKQAVVRMSTERMTEVELLDIKDGMTCCHILGHTISFGNVEMLRYLLQHGFSATATDKNERTALHLACYLGKTDMAIELIEFGAEHTWPDSKGLRPLDLATREGHVETALQVLRCRCPRSAYGWRRRRKTRRRATLNPLQQACREGYTDLVPILLEEYRDRSDLTRSLDLALEFSPPAVVDLLLKAGADVHVVSPILLRRLKADIASCSCQSRETNHAWYVDNFMLLQRYGLDWASVGLSSESDIDSP